MTRNFLNSKKTKTKILQKNEKRQNNIFDTHSLMIFDSYHFKILREMGILIKKYEILNILKDSILRAV